MNAIVSLLRITPLEYYFLLRITHLEYCREEYLPSTTDLDIRICGTKSGVRRPNRGLPSSFYIVSPLERSLLWKAFLLRTRCKDSQQPTRKKPGGGPSSMILSEDQILSEDHCFIVVSIVSNPSRSSVRSYVASCMLYY